MAKIIAAHAPLHGGQQPGQPGLLSIALLNQIVDLLHGLDINLPDKLVKYTYFDPVIIGAQPELREAVFAFYLHIGCYLDVREKPVAGGKSSWFHGSVWHYNFVLGTGGKSYGLKLNVFILHLIVFGVTAEHAATAEQSGVEVEDDVPTTTASKRRKKDQPIDSISDTTALLKLLFGHNHERVRTNFEATDGYGALFDACCDEWDAEPSVEYKEARALGIYKAGNQYSAGLKACSQGRHKSQYVPMFLGHAALQTAEHGDLWPYSTRSVEGRGGRIKKAKRNRVCHRARTTSSDVMRAVRNLKNGALNFKATNYNSSASEQMMRVMCQQEESAHVKNGRQRLATTGRKTLNRAVPKWETDELPRASKPMLEIGELRRMVAFISNMAANATWGVEMPTWDEAVCEGCAA